MFNICISINNNVTFKETIHKIIFIVNFVWEWLHTIPYMAFIKDVLWIKRSRIE